MRAPQRSILWLLPYLCIYRQCLPTNCTCMPDSRAHSPAYVRLYTAIRTMYCVVWLYNTRIRWMAAFVFSGHTSTAQIHLRSFEIVCTHSRVQSPLVEQSPTIAKQPTASQPASDQLAILYSAQFTNSSSLN